jgi:hypothetical protein
MSHGPRGETRICDHCRFGLIVTGKGERNFLRRLFSGLESHAGCSFRVLRKIAQRSAITETRRLRMVGRGNVILPKDAEEIGLTARRFLRNEPCNFVILLDDVEHDRRDQLPAIWQRYRTAIDTMLQPHERKRASVHFLANMLEAYYFADASAVNAALGATVLLGDRQEDVETIRHPKNELKDLARAAQTSFDEVADGGQIVSRMNVDRILARPDTCPFLRALFAWCVKQLIAACPIWDESLGIRFALGSGVQAELTRSQ